MESITSNDLRAKVKSLAKQNNFQIQKIFSGKDDYSKPGTGLAKRPEILIGCQFSDLPERRKVSLEYRLFNGKFNSFIAVIGDRAFESYPQSKAIIEKGISEKGVRHYSSGGSVVAELEPNMASVQTFLTAYFAAQKQADSYISEKIESERKLNSKYLRS